MSGWDAIVERKIAEAQRAGAFDDLPGTGRPLDLEDDRLVPEDVRVGYRILRNAGCVPAELVERKEAAGLRKLLASIAAGDPDRRRLLAKLALLEARMEVRPPRRSRGCP
ncbi:MAG: DnaJ family domain-containing protein [Burkholderiales bacterium]